MPIRRRCLAWLLLLLALVARAAVAAPAPSLVVVIVIDGLPQEQVVRYRDLYGSGGFRLLLEQGAWFGNAHHGHAVTLTAPGHASVLTGTYPYRHGIIANEWIDRTTLQQVYCTDDAGHTYLGDETKKLDGTSPARLRVSTLGDELRYATGNQSKVVTVSGKDRGAILLAGKTGTAYMYMAGSGRFASSTFYMKEHPEWHARYYAGRPQDRWAGRSWGPLLPEEAYARSMPEGAAWVRSYGGMGTRFPLALPGGGKADAAYYRSLILTPFGDEATLDFARATVEGENLGRNPGGVPDLLGVSLSTHDYVNHGFGPESRQSQDHLLRVDRALAEFFSFLDRRVGLDKVVIALTADHGFMNAPEYSTAAGLAGTRVNGVRLIADLNAHLAARFGATPLAARLSPPTVLLNQALIAEKKLDAAEVEAAAARFLAQQPNVATAFTRTQLERGELPPQPLSAQVSRAWHAQLSGDVYFVLNPYAILSSNVATHGSPYAYDTNVPLMIFGRPWIEPGRQARTAAVVDLAPTLAFLLEVRPPAASEGRVLDEIIRRGSEQRPR